MTAATDNQWTRTRINRSIDRTDRFGFTLIEMIVALVLSVFLAIAVLGVLKSLKKANDYCPENRTPAWSKQLRNKLLWDITNARKMSVYPTELRLVGYGGHDLETGATTLRPCEIVYSIKQIGDVSWLVRREIHLDSLQMKNFYDELVCRDVDAIMVLDARHIAPDAIPKITPKTLPPVAQFAQIPNAIRVYLFEDTEDLNSLILHETFVLQ